MTDQVTAASEASCCFDVINNLNPYSWYHTVFCLYVKNELAIIFLFVDRRKVLSVHFAS